VATQLFTLIVGVVGATLGLMKLPLVLMLPLLIGALSAVAAIVAGHASRRREPGRGGDAALVGLVLGYLYWALAVVALGIAFSVTFARY
jgi:hypothetical protein